MAPFPRAVERVCGAEYQTAPTNVGEQMQLCSCGTGAVGRCTRDAQWKCGYHSSIVGGVRLCNDCIAADRAAAANAEREVERERLATARATSIEGSLNRIEKFRAGLFSTIGIERFVLLKVFVAADAGRAPRQYEEVRAAVSELVADALRDEQEGLVRVERDGAYGDEVVLYGVAGVKAMVADGLIPPSSATLALCETRDGLFGGTKYKTTGHLEAWLLARGHSGTGGQYGSSGSPDKYFVADGAIVRPHHKSKRLIGRTANQYIETATLLELVSAGLLTYPTDLAGLLTLARRGVLA